MLATESSRRFLICENPPSRKNFFPTFAEGEVDEDDLRELGILVAGRGELSVADFTRHAKGYSYAPIFVDRSLTHLGGATLDETKLLLRAVGKQLSEGMEIEQALSLLSQPKAAVLEEVVAGALHVVQYTLPRECVSLCYLAPRGAPVTTISDGLSVDGVRVPLAELGRLGCLAKRDPAALTVREIGAFRAQRKSLQNYRPPSQDEHDANRPCLRLEDESYLAFVRRALAPERTPANSTMTL